MRRAGPVGSIDASRGSSSSNMTLDLELGEVGAEAEVRAAAAEGHVRRWGVRAMSNR